MHKYFNCLILLAIFCCSNCSPNKKVQRTKTGESGIIKDSIEFYETDYDVRAKNYMALLLGSWTINTMQRQPKLKAEALTNTYLQFNVDSTFTGSAGCNRISGKFSIKGTSIKCSNIISTKMSCTYINQEIAFLHLLEETVSAYTVTATDLWLRDGSSNIIFRATRTVK